MTSALLLPLALRQVSHTQISESVLEHRLHILQYRSSFSANARRSNSLPSLSRLLSLGLFRTASLNRSAPHPSSPTALSLSVSHTPGGGGGDSVVCCYKPQVRSHHSQERIEEGADVCCGPSDRGDVGRSTPGSIRWEFNVLSSSVFFVPPSTKADSTRPDGERQLFDIKVIGEHF